jgi:hypothetical protein
LGSSSFLSFGVRSLEWDRLLLRGTSSVCPWLHLLDHLCFSFETSELSLGLLLFLLDHLLYPWIIYFFFKWDGFVLWISNFFFKWKGFILWIGNFFFKRDGFVLWISNFFFKRDGFVLWITNFFFKRDGFVFWIVYFFFERDDFVLRIIDFFFKRDVFSVPFQLWQENARFTLSEKRAQSFFFFF